MLESLKKELICEMEDVGKDGVKTGNIEYICKLAETYKNLNKAEKEELESMLYDERLNYKMDNNRSYRYFDSYNDGRGRDMNSRRDSNGRYSHPIRPIDEFYGEYMGAKRRYMAGDGQSSEMMSGLEMMMKHITMLIEDVYSDCSSEEERRIIERYIKRLSEMR